jgi:hypothetical protein
MARDDALLVLLSEAEKAQLRELAAKDGRSMGSYLRWLVQQAANGERQRPQAA